MRNILLHFVFMCNNSSEKMNNLSNKNLISFKERELTDFRDTDVYAPLVAAMKRYKERPCTGFHIPGHNRGQGVLPQFTSLVGRDV